jgi:murein L,D-transpeptidase YcbB/YkuD
VLGGLASPARGDELEQGIAKLVREGRHPDLRWPDFADVRATVDTLYRRNAGRPLWLEAGRPTVRAQQVLARIQAAPWDGLDPDDLDAGRLASAARELHSPAAGHRAGELARFDVALTVATARHLSTLERGRISPRRAHATLDIPRPPFDLAGAVEQVRRSDDVSDAFRRVEPGFAIYRGLKRGLARVLAISRDSTLLPLPPMPKLLEPGAGYPGAGDLRRLLTALGDLSPDPTPPAAEADTVYDSTLVEGIRRFQQRHGAKGDGRVGPATQRQLGRPFGERIRQIELSLERLRWLPRDYAAAPVFVNVPSFRLLAVGSASDTSAPSLAMDVVVGAAYQHETPVFVGRMTHVVLRPYWDVPLSIQRKEIRPKAVRDPSYLTRNRYELIRDGRVVAADAANAGDIGRAVRVRQRPGEGNALGDVKFMLPNPHSVYLHDTPARSKFEEERRDFSHGCIRLSRPFDLLRFIVDRDQPGAWPPARVDSALALDTPTQIDLRTPLPVHIVYATVLAREDGDVLYFTDLYGHDEELTRLLRRGYPYPR